MAQIKIYGELTKGCIFFDGSTVEPKFLGTILAESKSDESDRFILYRTDRQDDQGANRKLFKRMQASRIQNSDGEDLVAALGYTTAQVVEYINGQANLTAAVNPVVDTSLNGVDISFKLDATSTSIILDNGYQFGANTIKAIDTGDGLITIKSIEDARTLFTELDHTAVDIDGVDAAGGLNDVINVLNELFTVGAFESVVISDPYATMVADVGGVDTSVTYVGYGIDPVGDSVYGSTNSNSQNGLLTTDTIDQAGEYFTFDIRVEGTIGFGLVHTQASYDAGHWTGNSTYADPTTFGVSNSAHNGYQFSHWFHPTPNGSWTNYGANTAYSMRSGWSDFNGTDEQADWLAGNPIKVRVGIDANSFISIETLRDGSSWVPHARTSYPVPQGSEFRLGIKTNHTGARVHSLPKAHLLEAVAPTMYFRYIESPDGVFHYPLFTTAEEAEYYDEIHNGLAEGTGSSHTHTYADDPTNTTWFMPEASHDPTSYQYSVAPDGTETFSGNAITYTEVTSLTDSDLTPSAFSFSDITQEEGTAVNLQLYPAGATFSQSVTISPNTSGLVYNTSSHYLQGTLAEVGSDTVYTITVIRANAYGSTTGTFTITATDVPVASSLTTPWNKAVVINGANEYLMQVSNSNSFNILNMGGMNNDVWGANNGKTSTDTDARPWSISQVVYIDNSQPQCYFSQAENYVNDRISLSTHETGAGSKIEFYWGRSTGTNGANSNGCQFLFDKPADGWYGYYIDTTGFRPNQAQSTTAALATNFRFKQVDLSTGTVSDITGTWAIVGDGRLNRGLNGDFYIGRESGSQSFNSNSSLKVAATLVSTLKRDFLLPDDTEISMQVRDPQQWVIDYRDGTQQRLAYNNQPYAFNTYPERCVALWLMGDGSLDSYSNNLRNDVKTADQNYTMLRLQNMVSNDIETVNINGLT